MINYNTNNSTIHVALHKIKHGNYLIVRVYRQESRTVARKPRDAAAVFGLKFADNVHCKFNSSQASKVRLQSSKQFS